MTPSIDNILRSLRVNLAAGRWNETGLQLYARLCALRFARHQLALMRVDVFSRHAAASPTRDVLFHLRHRHYLSTRFGYRQRLACALTHYRYDGAQHGDGYKEAVYHPRGLTLWTRQVGAVSYAIQLRATNNPRNEGGNSVVLEVDGGWLSEMSFVWLEGSTIGAPDGILPFITRNQSAAPGSPRLLRFRADFPHNSPAYFCLAALHGIASAHGHQRMAGIRHDCQIAFEPQSSDSFRRSYSEFWETFGGRELADHAYLMPVPPCHPPLSQVRAKHRKRAEDRRRNWATVTESALQAAAAHRIAAAANPAPAARPRQFAHDAVVSAHAAALLLLSLAP